MAERTREGSELFAGFTVAEHAVEGADLRVRVGGSGPALLLLHGYPQTGAMWHPVATALAEAHRVVVPDLRGYGASRVHDGDHTFRAMARDQVQLMAALGHDRFDVVGHDRGARTAHRLALDHPDAVRSVALLDVLPTLAVWENYDAWLARRYFHWTFLAQDGGLPERLISARPLDWLHHALGALGGSDYMHAAAVAAYEEAALDPAVVAGWCADYAAGAGADLDHDRADLGRGLPHRSLLLWGEDGVVGAQVDPLAAWRPWFPRVVGRGVPTGHFLVEEEPALVLDLLREHLAADD